jgi:LuxR family transcriptional regulator, maltose regulon positive regulatory protein
MAQRSRSTRAKLTRPRLRGVLQRGRLYALLDSARERSVIWIAAPAGAGKTTLVASYAEHRELPGLWIQLDAGDADAPTFFYYLGLAEQSLQRRRQAKRQPLPLLTAEFLPDLPGFARRYFRELFARLPSDAAVVFDNYHSIGEASPLHDALAEAFEEIPTSTNVIVISRQDPPPAFSRARASARLQLIGWEPLQLTAQESRDIVLSERAMDDAALAALQTRCGGWAAGLRLLMEGASDVKQVDLRTPQASTDTLYHYFEAQVISSLSAQQMDNLLRLAFVPTVSVTVAQTLTGDAHIGKLLEFMLKRQLFIVRLEAPAPTYRFHDLFRDFLRERVARTYSAEQNTQLMVDTAALLQELDSLGEAVALYARAERWDATAKLIVRHAAKLIATGRWNVVVEWVRQMPAAHYQSNSSLLYWLGVARSAVNPTEARVALEAAYDLASAQGAAIAALETAAAIVQTYMIEYTQFKPMDRWIPILGKAVNEEIKFPDLETEIRVLAALLNALTYRQPESALVDRCVVRIALLSQGKLEREGQFQANAALFAHGIVTGKLSVADSVHPRLVEILRNEKETAPYSLAWGLYLLSFYYYRKRQLKESRDAINRIQRIAEEAGLPALKRLVGFMGFWIDMEPTGSSNPESWREKLEELGPPVHPYDVALTQAIDGWRALFDNRPGAAVHLIESSVRYFDDSGSRMHRIIYREALALANYQSGDLDAAREALMEIDTLESRDEYWQRPGRLAIDALCELQRGHDEAEASALLATSLRLSRLGGSAGAFVFLRRWAPQLFQFVLEQNIEPEQARELIHHYEWASPSPDLETWPWPVKLLTLGEFTLLRHDAPLQFGHKAPRKLLQLLRALVAFGGKQVPQQRLIDALWAEQEGDTAYRALAVAIRRLRDLFHSDAAIEHVDGKVSLDAGQVWIDAHSFERLADAATDLPTRAKALQLYKGPFRADESDERWALQYRERLRAKFVRLVREQGAALEAGQAWQDAANCYAKGLEADDLAESFYQGLIRAQAQLGQRADALSTYRRMRQVLSVVLGIQPSADSEALYRSLSAST